MLKIDLYVLIHLVNNNNVNYVILYLIIWVELVRKISNLRQQKNVVIVNKYSKKDILVI
jgi:hypothetical protein